MEAENKTKYQLEAENENLMMWVGYIEYRMRHEWGGAGADYIRVDLQNILTKMKNEINGSSPRSF